MRLGRTSNGWRPSGIYRDVLALHDMMGLKNQEIAQALGVSPPTVKVRLHRARNKLRESPAAGCDFGHDDTNPPGE